MIIRRRIRHLRRTPASSEVICIAGDVIAQVSRCCEVEVEAIRAVTARVCLRHPALIDALAERGSREFLTINYYEFREVAVQRGHVGVVADVLCYSVINEKVLVL